MTRDLDAATELARARAAADHLLRFRPRSEQELRLRLGRKGFSEPAIDAIVQELARKDLLNDRKFAQYYATNRLLSRPSGLRAVRDELRRKGLASAVVEQAVAEASAGYDETVAARELAQRRLGQWRGLPTAVVQRRLAGVLQRRGFSGEIVYQVVREVTGARNRE